MFQPTLLCIICLHGAAAFQASVFRPSEFSSSQLSHLDQSSKKDKQSTLPEDQFTEAYTSNVEASNTVHETLNLPGDEYMIKDRSSDGHLANGASGTSGAHMENYDPPTLAQYGGDEIAYGLPENQDRAKSDGLDAKRERELEQFKAKTNQLTNEVDTLTSQKQEQKAMIRELQDRLEKLDGKDKEKEKELENNKYEEAKMKKEIQYLNKMMEELRTANEDLKKQMREREGAMMKDIDDCQMEKEDLRQDIDWQIDNLAAEKAKLKLCEEEKSALKPKSAIKSGENETLSRTTRELHEECPEDFTNNYEAGICYGFIVDTPLIDYSSAVQICKTEYGGRLAVLNTKDKFDAVSLASRKEHLHDKFWVGGERIHGIFQWLDGSEFGAYVFGDEKPDNLRQRCVRLGYPSHNIDPESCASKHYAVCEVISR